MSIATTSSASPSDAGDVSALVQSPPLDLTSAYSATTLKGKTALITGCASGIGAAIARRWAEHGAWIIVCDIADSAGESLVAELRQITEKSGVHSRRDNSNETKQGHYYIHMDVTDFTSQATAFRTAASLSVNGRIDMVVANAGVAETSNVPGALDRPWDPQALLAAGQPGAPELRAPNLLTLETNLIGLAYTVHLALFWLGRSVNDPPSPVNPRAPPSAYETTSMPLGNGLDRHLLLLGSVASLVPLPGTPQYTAAKHGVLGLFRSLRGMVWKQGHGVRINLLCPYFIDTPILHAPARSILAGGGMGSVDDVVEAATRLAADEEVVGRAVAVGPKVRVKGNGMVEQLELVEMAGDEGWGSWEGGRGNGRRRQATGSVVRGAWEIYAHDYVLTDVFIRRFVRLLNAVETARGWVGWGWDFIRAWQYGFPVRR